MLKVSINQQSFYSVLTFQWINVLRWSENPRPNLSTALVSRFILPLYQRCIMFERACDDKNAYWLNTNFYGNFSFFSDQKIKNKKKKEERKRGKIIKKKTKYATNVFHQQPSTATLPEHSSLDRYLRAEMWKRRHFFRSPSSLTLQRFIIISHRWF